MERIDEIELTLAEQERVNDMLSQEVFEIAEELGIKPDERMRFSEADQLRLIERCRAIVIASRD
jgi:hypothetical protein